jgi:phosphoglycolate phosphatase
MDRMAQARPSFAGCTVVFDLDGTIADTAPDLIEAANVALEAHGYPAASAEAIKPGVGYGTKAMLRAALASQNIALPSDLKPLADALVAHYADHIAVRTRPFPAFTDAANALREAGATLAVCTNKREALALKLLDALGLTPLFAAIAGGDTYAFHKPDPRHILQVIADAGGDATRSVMVGDSEADIAAAQAAGVFSVAVSFGYASKPAQELGANAVIDTFADLPSVAARLLGLG